MLRVRGLSLEAVEQPCVFMGTTRDVRLYKRGLMVWPSHQGKTTEISTELDVNEQAVRDWIRAYEEQGLDGLRADPRCGELREECTSLGRVMLLIFEHIARND